MNKKKEDVLNKGVILLNALLSGFTVIVRKPIILLAALLAAFLNVAIFFLSYDPLLKFFYEVIYLEAFPQVSIFKLPFRIIQLYPLEVSAIVLGAFLNFVIYIWIFFIFGKFIMDFEKGQASIGDAFKFGISKIFESLKVAIFLFIVAFLYFLIMFAFMFVSTIVDIVGVILTIAWLIVGIYLLIKLAFLPAVVAVENEKLKVAVAKTWSFSGKYFFSVVAFLIIIFIITSAIETIGINLSDLIEDEILSVLVLFIFVLISISYSSIAMIKYYLNKKQ